MSKPNRKRSLRLREYGERTCRYLARRGATGGFEMEVSPIRIHACHIHHDTDLLVDQCCRRWKRHRLWRGWGSGAARLCADIATQHNQPDEAIIAAPRIRGSIEQLPCLVMGQLCPIDLGWESPKHTTQKPRFHLLGVADRIAYCAVRGERGGWSGDNMTHHQACKHNQTQAKHDEGAENKWS